MKAEVVEAPGYRDRFEATVVPPRKDAVNPRGMSVVRMNDGSYHAIPSKHVHPLSEVVKDVDAEDES